MAGEFKKDHPTPTEARLHSTRDVPGQYIPKDLKIQIKEQKLTITWDDDSISDFSLAFLRKHCPCATCRTEQERKSANPLNILSFDPSNLKVVSAKLVGNYAIQFIWSDNHNTGIFDFRYLHSLKDLPQN